MTYKKDKKSDNMTNGRRTFLKLAGTGAVAPIVGLAGCSGGDGGDGDGSGGDIGDGDGSGGDGGNGDGSGGATTTEQDLEPLRIGQPEALTGPYSTGAKQKISGTEMAVKHLREDPDFVREVQHITGDTELNPSKGVEVTRRMIQEDEINAFSGFTASSTALAANELLKQNQIPWASGQASDKFRGEQCHLSRFSTYSHATASAQAAIPMVFDQELGTSWYSITADYAFGQDQEAAIRSFAENDDAIEYLGNDNTPFGHSDYAPQFARVRQASPDVLFLNHWAGDTAAATKQAISAGLHDEMEIVVPLWIDFAAAQLSRNSLQHIYGGVSWTNQLDNFATQSLNEAFLEENGELATESNYMNYKGTRLIGEAVKEAGTVEGAEVSRVLREKTFSELSEDLVLHGKDDERFRKTDHVQIKPYYQVRGKSPDQEREGRLDVFELVGTVPIEDAVPESLPSCNISES